MGRAPACSKEDKEGLIIRMDLKKGAWTAEEDEKLVCFIRRNKGHGSWRTLPTLAGLDRCGKSCRLRWTNYLRPNIKRGNFSAEEERIILQLHAVVGNKWSTIASHLPGRTDNEVKNHWNTHLKKRLAKMGIDPVTHLPLKFLLPHHHTYGNLTSPHLWHSDWQKALLQQCLQLDSSIASHLVQWELARLEAEARQQLVNTHGAYIQNYYASFQQSLQQNLQQNQAPPFNMNDLIHAWNLQLQATSGSLTNSSNVLSTKPHIEDSQSHDNSTFLKNLYPSLFQATDLNPSIVDYTSTGTIDKESTIPNDETVEHILDDHVHTIASASVATSDTCSTSDTISSQLNPNQFVLLDDFDFDLYANASYNTTTNNDSHNSSPLANDDLSQHDSYWHRMLNLCSHVTFDEL